MFSIIKTGRDADKQLKSLRLQPNGPATKASTHSEKSLKDTQLRPFGPTVRPQPRGHQKTLDASKTGEGR
jgi:hypothetical protein